MSGLPAVELRAESPAARSCNCWFRFYLISRRAPAVSPLHLFRYDASRFRGHSHPHSEKSFSNWGTWAHTPFSFLFVMLINCGWYRKPAAASVASKRWASPRNLARSASVVASVIDLYSALKASDL